MKRRRRHALFAGVALFLTMAVGIPWAVREWWWGAEVTIREAPPPSIRLTADEQAFYAYVSPRLRALAGEARTLAALGAERSRNLLELQTHGDNVTELVGEINAFVEANGLPERFAAVMATYRDGAVKARQGMTEARQGFLRFDWDRVGAAVTLFTGGAELLEQAADEMDEAVGIETPSAAATPVARFVRYSVPDADRRGPVVRV